MKSQPLKAQRLPERPAKFIASELLHGDVDGFIINAYLAMQRQWPDEGGFGHYRYILSKEPWARARVLRELAGSQVAKTLGASLVDDLPADHGYDPQNLDPAQQQIAYQAVSNRLRLLHVIHESRAIREALSRITLEGIADAVQTIVDTAMGSLAQLDSRISEVESGMEALRALTLSAIHSADGSESPQQPTSESVELTWLRHEVLRLGRRLQALEGAEPAVAPVAAVSSVDVSRIDAELAQLKEVVMPLHHFTTVDLKRYLADYVNALVLAHAEANTHDQAGLVGTGALKVDDGL
ncbi:hypothetical protein [Ideonella sp.]|uniref:hypothetical protein n=1 Tax=Ideonella sp. TaxID=1929293 RepID=UPI003BB6263D